MATYITGTDQVIFVHDFSACKGSYCVIHNPSNHAMSTWPTHWRGDRKLMERICPHGIGHPDPDDMDYYNSHGGTDKYRGIHGCDGCCIEPREERESNP